MSALLFGSISTLADTSELQRESFNEAFLAHGLDWVWGQEDYAALLGSNGGRDRVAEYADGRGERVDADAIHRTKSQIFQDKLGSAGIAPRPGVVETIDLARREGLKVALVTTTSPENVTALLKALGPDLGDGAFDLVVDASKVTQPKPDKAAYVYALEQLGEEQGGAIAIEDNLGGIQSAAAAGITAVAFPNTNTAGHDFENADRRVDHLSWDGLQPLIA